MRSVSNKGENGMHSRESFWKTVCAFGSLGIIIFLIILGGYNNFVQHRNTVIRQQQEHLLTTAKSISRSLDVYLNKNIDRLYVLAQNPIIIDLLKHLDTPRNYLKYNDLIKNFYNNFKDEIEQVLLFDVEGRLIHQYPDTDNVDLKTIDADTVRWILENKRMFVTKEYQSANRQFSIDILQPCINSNGEVEGVLISTTNLNRLYNTLIQPIRLGSKGFAMVKNQDNIIIMHPSEEQIGLSPIEVTRAAYPEFDLRELEKLYQKQKLEKEGYHIYYSYWWQDSTPQASKKISAYTTRNAGDISWIIAVQMDYKEIEQPIQDALVNITSLFFFLTVFLMIIAFVVFRTEKEKKALQIETKYLKQLNKTWDELIKSEAKLRHAQKLQTIGMLTSGIVHELNHLLSPILGYSELLLYRIDSKNDIHEDIWEINRSALKAREIIKQILVFTRNDSLASEKVLLNVETIIKESLKLIEAILPKNIKIVLDIQEHATIKGHPIHLEQVLINLYTNAYQAMKVKGGILAICVDNVFVTGEEFVRVQIKDTGEGMDEITLRQIFDPFFTTKAPGEGTGLGLGVVQSIIKEHKGEITIQSQLGKGTIVSIYLKATY